MQFLATTMVLFLLIAVFFNHKIVKIAALGMAVWGGYEMFARLGLVAKIGIAMAM